MQGRIKIYIYKDVGGRAIAEDFACLYCWIEGPPDDMAMSFLERLDQTLLLPGLTVRGS